MRIYRISNAYVPNKTYVGQTTRTLKERLKEHIAKPVNQHMSEFLKTPGAQIELLTHQKFKKSDTRGILSLEHEYITKLKPTLNVSATSTRTPDGVLRSRRAGKNAQPGSAPASEPTHLRSINITESRRQDGSGTLRINWTEDSKYKQKKFRFTAKTYASQRAAA